MVIHMRPADSNRLRRSLEAFMAARGLKPLPWAEAAGLSPGAIYNFLKGRSASLSMRAYDQLARAASVSPAVLRGEAPIPPADASGNGHAEHNLPAKMKLLPVIDYIQAGRWTETGNSYEPGAGHAVIATEMNVGEHAFALDIRGTSMEPLFHDGDRVIIDPDVAPGPGDFVAAKRDGDDEATFKKFRPRGRDKRGHLIIELVPLNEDWPVLIIDAAHPGHIIGTMIERRDYRRR